jgi:hypothetical protein
MCPLSLPVHTHRDRSGPRYYYYAGPAIRRAIKRNVAVANQLNSFDSQRLHQRIMHARAHIFTTNAGQSNSGGDQIVAMNQSSRAGFIDSFANCGGAAANPNPQRIRWPSRAFPEYLRAVHDGRSGSRAAAIHADNQLSQRRKSARQNVDGLNHSRHLVIRCPGGLLRFPF